MASRGCPAPRHVLCFDRGGNMLLSRSWGGVDALSFPVASLMPSIHAYANDGGLGVEHVVLEHCAITFRRCVGQPLQSGCFRLQRAEGRRMP
jgi:hypothetical protein